MVHVTYWFDEEKEESVTIIFEGSLASFCQRISIKAKLKRMNADLVGVYCRNHGETAWLEVEAEEIGQHTTPLAKDADFWIHTGPSKRVKATWTSAILEPDAWKPDQENLNDWDTSNFKFELNDGLPRYHCQRAKKLHQLLKMLATPESSKILVSAPPQSGKTTMAQLFMDYVDYAKRKIPGLEDLECVFITLSGYNNQTEDSLQVLETYLREVFGIQNLNEFQTKYAWNPNCIIVLDEAQKAYHLKESFWTKFKPGPTGVCSLLAFSAFSIPTFGPTGDLKDNDPNATTRMIFNRHLPYAFIAFNQSEFDLMMRNFEQHLPDLFKPNASESVPEFIGKRVRSLALLADGVDPPQIVYHPGLVYAIYDRIRVRSINDNDPIGSLKQGNELYLALLPCVRVFRHFVDLECVFSVNYDAQFPKSHQRGPDYMAARDRFWLHLQYLVSKLVQDGFVDLAQMEMDARDVIFYRQLLIRHALCCTTAQETTDVIHLSCALVGAHFLAETVTHFWGQHAADYEKLGLEKFIIHVVSNFDAQDMRTNEPGVARRHLESSYQTQFIIKASVYASRKLQAEYLALFHTVNKNGDETSKISGPLDIRISSDLHWGIEILRDSEKVLEHLARFEPGGAYHEHLNLKDYRLLDCVHTSNLDETKQSIMNAYMKLTNEQASKVLIAIFSTSFETVEFYQVSISSPENIVSLKKICSNNLKSLKSTLLSQEAGQVEGTRTETQQAAANVDLEN